MFFSFFSFIPLPKFHYSLSNTSLLLFWFGLGIFFFCLFVSFCGVFVVVLLWLFGFGCLFVLVFLTLPIFKAKNA